MDENEDDGGRRGDDPRERLQHLNEANSEESRNIASQEKEVSSRVPAGLEECQNVGFIRRGNANDLEVGRGAETPGGGNGPAIQREPSSDNEAEVARPRGSNSLPRNQEMVRHYRPHAANIRSRENVGNVGADDGVDRGVVLIVGELLWWTTDAQLESELHKYGQVKEVRFLTDESCGKSKGNCRVEFYDPAAAAACKEGMNGHLFNGKPCMVAYVSGGAEATVNRNRQQMGRRTVDRRWRKSRDSPGNPCSVRGNNITGNWGRRNSQGGMGNRVPVGPVWGWADGMAIPSVTGEDNGFRQNTGGKPPWLHAQTMTGQVFYPAFGGPMVSYGGFPGLPDVAPYVNPALIFGWGMPFINPMGMMPPP